MNSVTGEQLPLEGALYAYQLQGNGGAKPLEFATESSLEKPFWVHVNYSDEDSVEWFEESTLLPDAIKNVLMEKGSKPRISRYGEGSLITLRCINDSNEDNPDPFVALRVYLCEQFIISSRNRMVLAIDEISDELRHGVGPVSVGDWLVKVADALTEQVSDFVDDLHGKLIDLEDIVLDQMIPERSDITLIRKQLIILRRYLQPQREVFSRLASEQFPWLNRAHHQQMHEIADRLKRILEDVDACISRTIILSEEINAIMAESLNRRSYIMSLLAMIFLPATFLTGLFGVNLAGIPGAESPVSFLVFCGVILSVGISIAWFLKRSRWL